MALLIIETSPPNTPNTPKNMAVVPTAVTKTTRDVKKQQLSGELPSERPIDEVSDPFSQFAEGFQHVFASITGWLEGEPRICPQTTTTRVSWR
jgi:hypothetical protein